MIAKTNAQRQAEFRQRKAKEQETEVRGIYAPEPDHPPIKAYAAKLALKRSKATRSK